MAAKPETRAPIDEFLPECDFYAASDIRVNAPAAVMYQRLLVSDFCANWIGSLPGSVRTGRRIPRHRPPIELGQRFQGTGLVILADVPAREIVIGVAGRFWRPDGGRCLDFRAGDFVGFSRPGRAKVAMNFRITPESLHVRYFPPRRGSSVATERAGWRFRLYWSLVGLFSGVTRKAILKQIKAEAEAAVEKSLHWLIA